MAEDKPIFMNNLGGRRSQCSLYSTSNLREMPAECWPSRRAEAGVPEAKSVWILPNTRKVVVQSETQSIYDLTSIQSSSSINLPVVFQLLIDKSIEHE